MAKERQVLRDILDVILKYVPRARNFAGEALDRIKSLPDADVPIVHQTIIDSRSVFHQAPYLDDAIMYVVRMCLERGGVKGFEKGLALGYVEDYVREEANYGTMQYMAWEICTIIDVAYSAEYARPSPEPEPQASSKPAA